MIKLATPPGKSTVAKPRPLTTATGTPRARSNPDRGLATVAHRLCVWCLMRPVRPRHPLRFLCPICRGDLEGSGALERVKPGTNGPRGDRALKPGRALTHRGRR